MSESRLKDHLFDWTNGEIADEELVEALREAYVVLRTVGDDVTAFSVLRIGLGLHEEEDDDDDDYDEDDYDDSDDEFTVEQYLTVFTSMDNAKALEVPSHFNLGVVQLSDLIINLPSGIGIVVDPDCDQALLTPELLQKFKGETGPLDFESAFRQLTESEVHLQFVDPANLDS